MAGAGGRELGVRDEERVTGLGGWKDLVIICANGIGQKNQDGKSSYISRLTAGL